MNRNKYLAAWLGLVIFIAVFSQEARPGEGTLKPPCSRTIYLAKFSPGTVVIPESGAIEVPIGVLPFVSWNSVHAQCGQPTGASLELTLTCTPAGGGESVTIGPVSFDVPTPATPGAQDVGSPLTFTIPEGIISGTTPQTCLVSGTYTVTFGPGFGDGAISGTGDVPIVLIQPSLLEISRSKLEMFGLPFDGSDFRTARRGDQVTHFFLVVNNDPTESTEFEFTVTTNQTARLPDGFMEKNAAENFVYSIASPKAGTGNFPLAYTDDLDPFERIPLPDPTEINLPRIVRTLTLTLLVKKEITSNPGFLVFLVSQIVGGGGSSTFLLNREFADSDTIEVFDQDGMPVSGTVSVRGDGVAVEPTFDNGRIVVNYQIDDLPPIPATTLSFIDITVPDAINNPLTVPVVIRVDTSSSVTAVEADPSTVPETTQLLPNYPNPFNPATTISFDLNVTSEVTLLIYNLKGQVVRTLVERKFTAGSHRVLWDGRDDQARHVPGGLYVMRIQAGESVQHKKMLLIK